MKRVIIAVVVLLGVMSVGEAASIPSTRAAQAGAALRGTVNLNQADQASLQLLPTIGPAKAKRILDFRHAHPFKKVEELTRVKGIGRKSLARLRPYLAVAGQSTLAKEAATSHK